MNDKYFVRQRTRDTNSSGIPASTNKKPNAVAKKKENVGPKLTNLENLAA